MSSPHEPQPADSAYREAMAQFELGFHYHHELPTGDRCANLQLSIECYARALTFFTAEAAPAEYAAIQNNLGGIYAKLPTGDRTANLTQAIECFTEALRFYTPEAAPLDYSLTQHNLGTVYLELPNGNHAANLARAIGCFTEALRFATAEAAPLQYAATQDSLGNAYRALPSGDRTANLVAAADCYIEALRFRTAEAAPLEYAATQINVGNFYRELPFGDRTANLAHAIECFTEALRFLTAEEAPAEYAIIQHNLGAAYSELPFGDRTANLARAIEHLTEALRFRTAEAAPRDYAVTQDSLGTAYSELPGGDRAANLAAAIGCYTEALRFRTVEAAPRDYAATQMNLGTAYCELPGGDRAANLAAAIECYTEALRFFTAEAAPSMYATIKINLGTAYAGLLSGDRAAGLAQVVECYSEALRFFTAEDAPARCRLAARALGNIHFERGRWAEAHTAYSLAIHAGEFLYQATGSEGGRQAELGEAAEAVAADALCLARLGRLAEAVQRLEAGRARALSEALARDRAALHEASTADRAAFVAAADRIKALEAEGRRQLNTTTPGAWSFAVWSRELAQAREDLTAVIDSIRGYLPGFMGEQLDYQEVAAAASPTRPLAYLLTTSRGSLALLVPAGSPAPAPEHAIWLDSFTTTQLDKLLFQRHPSGEARGGYLAGQMNGDLDQLAAALTRTIDILRRQVLGPLAERLADLGLAAATVIPMGRLSLLPLSAAAPEGCTIALAPSARALHVARSTLRERAGEVSALLAVSNPLPPPPGRDPLGYASVEVRAIERLFPAGSRRILPEDAATGQAVTQSLPGTTHLHLACHGGFNLRNPLDSALHLAGGDRLTLHDLLDGHLDLSRQQLAVLSACQTGVIEYQRVPDEVIGLPAGFMQAGVPGVVATLWPVNDQSTAALVAEFYRLLLVERLDPATALTRACGYLRDATAGELAHWFESRYEDSGATDRAAYDAAAYLRARPDQADRPYADPKYWAGFVYSGP